MKFPAYKTVSVASLVPYARNSRTHSPQQVDKIAASIREFGFLNPIITDGKNGIVAGHGRVMAAQKLGLESLPVIDAAHLTEAQKRAYVIADNRLALDAGWDKDLLKIELQDLNADGFDLSLTGFNMDEIGNLLIEQTEGLTDGDAVPEVPAVSVTVEGDVWLLGRHRLMCGDSTNIDHLQRLCDGHLVDMWLTDPPYNVAYEGKTKGKLTIKNDSMCDDQFRLFLRDAYVAADAVMKAGAVFYIWHADSEGYNFRGAAKDAGWTVRQCLIWKKSTLVLAAKITSGCMSLAFTDGKTAQRIFGRRIEGKQPSCNSINHRATANTRP